MKCCKFLRFAVLLGVLSPHPLLAAEVEFRTNQGAFVLSIEEDKAPKTAANFLQYVRDGFFDGLIVHRIIPNFVIQGGGFELGMKKRPTRAAVINEADNGLKNLRYSISMARTSDPHSGTSQFFINLNDNANLDFRGKTPQGWGYAVFGRVVRGKKVIDRIAKTPTATVGRYKDVPNTPVVIEKAEIVAE